MGADGDTHLIRHRGGGEVIDFNTDGNTRITEGQDDIDRMLP